MALSPLTSEVYFVGDQDSIRGDQAIIAGTVIGGSDIFSGEDGAAGYQALGDADELQGFAKGGNDRFIGGDNSGTPDEFFFGHGFQSFSSGDYYDSVIFAGDAAYMGDNTTGGNDSITGGTNSGNAFFGDALEVATGSSKGGNDTIKGGNAVAEGCNEEVSSNYIVGDSQEMYCLAMGGADSLTGGNATSTEDGYAATSNMIVGDSYGTEGMTTGGADKIFGGNANLSGDGEALAFNMLSGDSYYLGCGAKGGADTMTGGNLNIAGTYCDDGDGYAFNMMAGDGFEMYDAIGGADIMTGGSVTDTNVSDSDGYALNVMAGDAFNASDSTYGADKLTGGSAAAGTNGVVINVIFGDVGSGDSCDSELYANDQLFGGNGQVINMLVGDAGELNDGDVGGNDKITAGKTLDEYSGSGDFFLGSGDFDEFLDYFLGLEGFDLGSGDGQNLMIGDAQYMDCGSQGGNDTLISGTGNDLMYGDAVYNDGTGGVDRFIFGVANGEDIIGDFSVCEGDKIDLIALKYNPQIRSFAGMNALATDRIVSDGDGGTYIYLGTSYNNPSNSIHLVGVPPEELTAACFIFG